MKNRPDLWEKEKEIVDLYLNKGKNPREIGKIFNCSLTIIYKILKNNNINMVYPKNKRLDLRKKSDEIVQLYRNELMNVNEIGKLFNCSSQVIKNILNEKNAVMGHPKRMRALYKNRKIKVWNKNLTKEMDDRIKTPLTAFKKGHKSTLGKKFIEINYPNYGMRGKTHSISSKDKMSNSQKELYLRGISNPFIGAKGKDNLMYGKKHSAKWKKERSLAMKGKNNYFYGKHFFAEKNSAWLGGKSFEPYDKSFNNKFKRAIRKRDNQVCMMCGIHREKLNRALDVHHINYDKKCSIPQNCISLCIPCHRKTNFDKDEWINFFQSLLTKRYNYKYSENKIILEVKR